MQWRNQQVYHLRQNHELTVEQQNHYFNEVVKHTFNESTPSQLLFSYLQGDECIGYGGLVHMNWIDKNAEISFVMNTKEESLYFEYHWVNFLRLIEKVAFEDLIFSKIFTYSYNIRPRLYTALEIAGFKQDARLPSHCIVNNKYQDVLIHSKKNESMTGLISATAKDIYKLYEWANDPVVRENAINSSKIELKQHFYWFTSRLGSVDCEIFIYYVKGEKVGQVRIDFEKQEQAWVIDYSIAAEHRGKKYGKSIILSLVELYPQKSFIALVKNYNQASVKVFEENKFIEVKSFDLIENQIRKFRYIPF
jgi:RimJ/RimL family protein N-acetyltransferase